MRPTTIRVDEDAEGQVTITFGRIRVTVRPLGAVQLGHALILHGQRAAVQRALREEQATELVNGALEQARKGGS